MVRHVNRRDGLALRHSSIQGAVPSTNRLNAVRPYKSISEPGKIVFVYRSTTPDPSLSRRGIAAQPTTR
jgi:hypothetical protein